MSNSHGNPDISVHNSSDIALYNLKANMALKNVTPGIIQNAIGPP